MRYIEPVLTAVRGPIGQAIRKVKQFMSLLGINRDTAIALCSLFVSVATVYFAREALKDQHHHNVLSVKPLPMLTVFDGQERVEVVLRNNGSGPLIIKDISVSDGKHVKKSVVEWMPDLPEGMRWEAFASEISERSLAPGGEVALIRLIGKQSDPAFRGVRDKCRDALSNLTVTVNYTDIYESSMDPHVRDLSWFGRHKKSEASPGTPTAPASFGPTRPTCPTRPAMCAAATRTR